MALIHGWQRRQNLDEIAWTHAHVEQKGFVVAMTKELSSWSFSVITPWLYTDFPRAPADHILNTRSLYIDRDVHPKIWGWGRQDGQDRTECSVLYKRNLATTSQMVVPLLYAWHDEKCVYHKQASKKRPTFLTKIMTDIYTMNYSATRIKNSQSAHIIR